ncbi:MAG: vWA domain-containing protein [Clostridium sp.]
MKFEDKRNMLLQKALAFQSTEDLNSDFKKEFFYLVENVVIDMLEKEDAFFGQFMIKIKRDIKLDITWPLATVPKLDGFTMYFNPILFLMCNKNEMGALFKHEIYHIMYSHYDREKELKSKYTKLAVNLALDISINQFIKNLPMNAHRIDTVAIEYDVTLNEDMVCEIYAELIEKAIKIKTKNVINNSKDDTICNMIDISKAHDVWSEVEINKDSLKDLTKKTAINAFKGKGPKDIVAIINSYNEKAEISWKDLLKKLLPSLRAGQKKTITRRNRRQPERLELRGTLPNNVPEILVAIDISASMSDSEVYKIMIEILGITKSRSDKITVIECDNEVKRVYEIKSKNDIKKRLTNTGSTLFSPVFEYIKKNNLRNHVLIYFTDGVGEEELKVRPINANTIWVLTGDDNLSLKKPYGEIKRINGKGNNSQVETSALNLMREFIHEWAR